MDTYTPEPNQTTAETASMQTGTPTGEMPPAMTVAPTDPVVGTGAFFGLEFVFAIPVIGFIVGLFLAFLPKNRNLKHYARAKLIWAVISLLITALLSACAYIFVQSLPALIAGQLDVEEEIVEQFFDNSASIPEIIEQVEDLGALAGAVGQLEDIGEVIGDAGALEEIIENVGGMENVEELIEEIGGIENIGKITEQFSNVENIEQIVDEVSSIENIEEVIEDVGGIDKIAEVDSLEEVMVLASEIEDPAVKEQVWDIIRAHLGE
ncbi:MAG: hypothetical protein E7604_07865 [Ruminococcaceae bacterium]|nr:hypothetical protein [Oscillospiraceae bacterium]